ncbi:2',5'-phosphodiesterase 12 [Eucyclogobius newberryi]|uniref:2',5'-phosphodiesterase 12 n=1 Tax=Eucyclogobius newberryi TaxID=166745 RepID=UPI003B5AAD66
MFCRFAAAVCRSHRRRFLVSAAGTRSSAWPQRGAMQTAVVRCVPGEPKLTISFCLDGSHKHMLRDQDEPVGKALTRIGHNLAKNQGKKKKKQRGEDAATAAAQPAAAEVTLLVGEDAVEESVLNAEAWRDGAVLCVGGARYAVLRNAPTFTTAELPRSMMAGFPVCPKLQLEFGNMEDCEFTWFKGACAGEGEDWVEAGSGRVFVPSNEDIGSKLRLRCLPKDEMRSGLVKELQSEGAIEAGPGTCTFDTRHLFTRQQTQWPELRVVSYNILADVYAQTELSKTVLYPYCAPYALELDYRINLVRKELSGYNADLICLQEVDKGVFDECLTPAMDAFGFDGVFRIKEKQHEGLATFYRRSRFRLLSSHDLVLSEALGSDPLYADLLQNLSSKPDLMEKILQRSTSLQVSVLQDLLQPDRALCVANTHLYWHPTGGNVRLVQMGVALTHLGHVISTASPGAALVFCGDFNSTPGSGVCELLTHSSVPRSHSDWLSSGPDHHCPMDLASPFPSLLSACGTPPYTNYVGGFQGCLDYVYIQPDHMEVAQVIPLPSHEEVTTYGALPSVSHPSDHISLVCDLLWSPQSKQ